VSPDRIIGEIWGPIAHAGVSHITETATRPAYKRIGPGVSERYHSTPAFQAGVRAETPGICF
jgi:hypothetical protein